TSTLCADGHRHRSAVDQRWSEEIAKVGAIYGIDKNAMPAGVSAHAPVKRRIAAGCENHGRAPDMFRGIGCIDMVRSVLADPRLQFGRRIFRHDAYPGT